MNKVLLTSIIYFFGLLVYGQEQITEELEKAYMEQKYDQILSNYADQAIDYPAKALYYIGMAYYMKGNDADAIKLMDQSIAKDDSDPDAYYMKGMTYNYMAKFQPAIESFNRAIELDSLNPHYYSGLGDSYISLEDYEQALSAYKTATQQEEQIDRPYAMIPQIYAKLGRTDKALESFYQSKSTVSKESDSYLIALYNIGVYEYLNREYENSEAAFQELIGLVPNDYQTLVKLIQVYYGKKEYEKAMPLKEKLYEANKSGILTGNLKEMFCFDQFEWKDKLILAYERYAIEDKGLYYKHIFFVTNDQDETEFTIQTENSVVSVAMGGPKYLLGMDKDGMHFTFNHGFEEDLKYDDLKKTVLKVLDDKIKPGSSSRKVKN